MKKNNCWIILPLLALTHKENGTTELIFGWLNKTYSIIF